MFDQVGNFFSNALPSFDVGTNYVPRDTLAKIHEGEAIIPKAFNPWAGTGAPQRDSNADVVRAISVRQCRVLRCARAPNCVGCFHILSPDASSDARVALRAVSCGYARTRGSRRCCALRQRSSWMPSHSRSGSRSSSNRPGTTMGSRELLIPAEVVVVVDPHESILLTHRRMRA